MSFLKKLKGMLSKEDKQGDLQEKIKEPFQKKYQHFRELLSNNNAVLETMADMEEKLSGEFLFDRRYIDSNVTTVTDRVKTIIDSLNAITRNKYHILNEKYSIVTSGIHDLLGRKREIPSGSYTLFLDEITKEKADRVGSKVANLGEIQNRIAIPVPHGFAISSYAFKVFMEHNDFINKINERLSTLSINDLEALNATSKEIQDIIIEGEIPPDLEKDILNAYTKLSERCGHDIRVSVRSSAVLEDSEFSFAGQYSTFLNIPSNLLLEKYKGVIASLFNPRALFYYKTKGFEEYEMVMPVGILGMIDAKAGGVMYSRDPNDPENDTIIISAIRGLGKCVVDGLLTPETYWVSRSSGGKIIDRKLPKQTKMLVCNLEGGTEELPVDASIQEMPSLTDEEAKMLSGYAVSLENHFQRPQDIEWAIDKNNQLYILQSRPLKVTVRKAAKPVPTHVRGYKVLLEKGVIACKGIGFGKAFIVRTDDDLKNFPEGAVLVARHTSTKFVTVMNKAGAIITDVGATTGHMASLTREFQIPAILDAEVATDIIKNGQEITVDAINCNIYEGRVKELEEFAEKKEEPFKETPIFRTLEKVLRFITPLNLVDPDNEKFKPESCKTIHDITRFCHEMVMRELFDITGTSADDVAAVKLVAGIPTEIYLLDLGGGIEGTPKYLNPEHLRSAPFNAFLKGLTSMKWPEARAFDVKGFLGAVAHTATISEEEMMQTAEKSFSFITKDYMNFAIRLGYHLSTVEAFAGENINDNYIKFFFKGGGAILDRRLRRVRLITEILKRMDFNVKIIEDVIEASLTKYKKPTIEKILEIMGKLTVYTKQLDMVMYNDAITEHYIEEFCKEHITEN
jgi:pyruvate,water dikinase